MAVMESLEEPRQGLKMQHVEALPDNGYPEYPEDQWHDEVASLQGSVQNSSGPDEEVFDSSSHRSSPRTSHGSFEGAVDEDSWVSQPPKSPMHTPIKPRSPFRNPSSVRAMQTDITPPERHSFSASRRKKISTPTRQGTPRSTHSLYSPMRSPDKKTKREFPLVLLHVTLLAIPTHYSAELLEEVLPPTIATNWRLLEEKIAQTVLERGILIPHPREDYDLLEERLLESLDLKAPRILKCGHFHLTPEEEADVIDRDSEEEDEDEGVDTCEDCGRKIRDGSFGDAGSGSKRWDVKVFAANGLMRAGAWSAAWKEMERVDVQILPWMEEGMRRELERRRHEDETLRAEHEQISRDHGVGSLDDDRLREIYGQNPADLETEPAGKVESKAQGHHERKTDRSEQLPLVELLKRFLLVSAQDRKNITIILLSILVFFLALQVRPTAVVSPSVTTPAIPSAILVSSSQPVTSTTPATSEVTPSFEGKQFSEAVPGSAMKVEQEQTLNEKHSWAKSPVEGSHVD